VQRAYDDPRCLHPIVFIYQHDMTLSVRTYQYSSGVSLRIDSEGIELRSYLAVPESEGVTNGLVLCHGFPQASREAASAGLRYSELADRIAEQVDMTVLTFNFRGTGQSEGDFSLKGWCADLRAAIAQLRLHENIENVWLAGFGVGASLQIYVAAEDSEVRGVCAFSARAHFDDWADNGKNMLEHARNFGMIRTPEFPRDPSEWADELRQIRPLDAIGRIPPRPIMLVHGAQDERVPPTDARELAAACDGSADLRIIHGAGHRLRHDPRIVALLLGWLDRQR
jgi:uncharacterized protein